MKHKITSKMVVLSMLLALIFSAVGAGPAQASGPFTHNEVVRMAISGRYGRLPPDLVSLLTKYPGAVESGSVFPDWGMGVRVFPLDTDSYDILAEDAHHQKFVDAFLESMINSFSPPYSENELKTIAFYFGLLSHNTADPAFHDGFVPTAKAEEWFDIATEGDHFEIEMAVDSFNYGGKYCGLFCPIFVDYKVDWFTPDETILAAYSKPGVTTIALNRDSLIAGWGEYQNRSISGLSSAWHLYGRGDLSRMHWTYLNYYSYPSGGTEDQARETVISWNQAWEILTKPTTAMDISPVQPDGNNGWYRQPVTVTLNATSAFFGKDIRLFTTRYSIDDGQYQQYVSPITVSAEGIHPISYYSVDSFGNSEAARSQTIKIDMTPPTITGAATTAPNSNGWYNNSVTVHFDAQDLISGLHTQTPDQTLSEEGAGQSVIGTAVDLAGNTATFTVGPINVDKTPPAISGEATTLPNDNGWYNTDVTVHFSAEDGLSGVNAVSPDVTITSEGAGQSVAGNAVDLAGNLASVTVGPINIDKTPPLVTVSVDKDRYTKTEPFTAHFNGSDALSGLSSLTAEFNGQSVTDGQVVDLFWLPLGTHTLTVRAEDLAGNVTETSQSIELSATLESLKETVARLCTEGYITKNSTCQRLSARLDAATVAHNRGDDRTAANLLRVFQNVVNAQTDKSIQGLAAQLLLLDSEYMKDQLSR